MDENKRKLGRLTEKEYTKESIISKLKRMDDKAYEEMICKQNDSLCNNSINNDKKD